MEPLMTCKKIYNLSSLMAVENSTESLLICDINYIITAYKCSTV